MIRLTPELYLYSAFDGDTDATKTRELDFNLARRSAVVVNHVIGQVQCDPDTTTGFDVLRSIIQELDLDPDNTTIEFSGAMEPDDVVYDSSRIFRQVVRGNWDTAAGPTMSPTTVLSRDWSHLPLNERPISITNMRHHCRAEGTISNNFRADLAVAYVVVELTLQELGVINASRR